MTPKLTYYNLAPQKKINVNKILKSTKAEENEGENFKSFEDSAANVKKKMSVDNTYKSSTEYMKAKENVLFNQVNKENIFKPKGGINFTGMPKTKRLLVESGRKIPLSCCNAKA